MRQEFSVSNICSNQNVPFEALVWDSSYLLPGNCCSTRWLLFQTIILDSGFSFRQVSETVFSFRQPLERLLGYMQLSETVSCLSSRQFRFWLPSEAVQMCLQPSDTVSFVADSCLMQFSVQTAVRKTTPIQAFIHEAGLISRQLSETVYGFRHQSRDPPQILATVRGGVLSSRQFSWTSYRIQTVVRDPAFRFNQTPQTQFWVSCKTLRDSPRPRYILRFRLLSETESSFHPQATVPTQCLQLQTVCPWFRWAIQYLETCN